MIWTDDPKSDEVIERARRRGHEVLTVGRKGEAIRLVEQKPTALGQTLMLEHGGKSHRLALPLIGAYQAANVLTAAGLVLATGGEWDATFSAMQRVAPVRGRLERAVISRGGRSRLHRLCAHARCARSGDRRAAAARRGPADHGLRRGGDRDQGKRPEMGARRGRVCPTW